MFAYCAKHVSCFDSTSVPGDPRQEAGADAVVELTLTIADTLEYVR
jgi:methylmalonyl-CoA mutase N-terminal domain/subunit